VFIDAQNMYRGARRAYGWEGHPGQYGNFKPIGLARILTMGDDRDLTEVRVYTGVPTAKRNPHGNAITQRRMAAWIADNPKLVRVFPRSLRYPPPEGREKGVDVELAIDFARLALDDEYDIAVLASTDTDLVPPLELVVRRCPDKIIETAAYKPVVGCEDVANAALDLSGGGVIRKTIDKKHFDRIADTRNFVSGSRDPAEVVGKSRWAGIMRRLTP
jgi:uncharacterized LabA/DUF88 family protein